VVALSINVRQLAESLSRHADTTDGYIAVVDDEGRIVARAPYDPEAIGQTIPLSLYSAIRDGAQHAVIHNRISGAAFIVGGVALHGPGAGLMVVAAKSRQAALAAARSDLLQNGIVALAVLVLAIMAARWVAYRLIEKPIRHFVQAAERHAAGETDARFAIGGPKSEFRQLGAALDRMAESIALLLEQKNLLLREVQHRVMNSLQLLASFLHLQARRVDDEAARKHLQDARERIVSMSVIYRHLYHSEATSAVDFAGVLKTFCDDAARAYLKGGRAIAVEAVPVTVSIQTALSLSLILHELLTNAMKHAYQPGRAGALRAELATRDGMLTLAVTDEGLGLPAEFDLAESRSLGLTVVQSLVQQLAGTLCFERLDPGTRFVVTVPLSEVAAPG
jgi:two-component sensor histidine kinase